MSSGILPTCNRCPYSFTSFNYATPTFLDKINSRQIKLNPVVFSLRNTSHYGSKKGCKWQFLMIFKTVQSIEWTIHPHFPNCLHLNFSTLLLNNLFIPLSKLKSHSLFNTASSDPLKYIFPQTFFITLGDKSFLNGVIIKNISCFRNKMIIIIPHSRKCVMQEACSYLNWDCSLAPLVTKSSQAG